MYVHSKFICIDLYYTQSDKNTLDSVLRQQHNDHPQQPEDQLQLPRKKEFLALFWDE